MNKEYYKDRIADKRKDMVSLRAKIVSIKERKKSKMEYLTRSIKNTSSKSSKESYRKQKISEAAKYVREIDGLKSKIESVKKDIENLRSSLAKAK